MKGFDIIKGCIICGVLFSAVFFLTAGTSFGQGLTDNMSGKGFDRFIYPERIEKNGFSQNPLYGFSCPLWLINAGNKFNFPLTDRQKAISRFTSFSQKQIGIFIGSYIGNAVKNTTDFKLNHLHPRSDWDYKIKQMKVREDMNFKIIHIGPK